MDTVPDPLRVPLLTSTKGAEREEERSRMSPLSLVIGTSKVESLEISRVPLLITLLVVESEDAFKDEVPVALRREELVIYNKCQKNITR